MKPVFERSTSREVEFQTLLDQFAALLFAEGILVTAYTGSKPRHFMALDTSHQQQTLENFRRYVEVCQEVVAQGIGLRDDKMLAWRMFQKMKVHPPSDLMQEIRQGEVIEIYNSDFVQTFRNMRFFEICSYPLDELLCRPFWELVYREESITQMIVHQASRLLSGTVSGLFQFDIPEHSIFEIESPGRNVMVVKQRIGAPLLGSDGAPAALIAFLHVSACVRMAGVTTDPPEVH